MIFHGHSGRKSQRLKKKVSLYDTKEGPQWLLRDAGLGLFIQVRDAGSEEEGERDAFLDVLIEVFDEFRSQYQLDSEDESLENRVADVKSGLRQSLIAATSISCAKGVVRSTRI